jgi:hydroxybutyrate-dimer hydrolase
METIKVDLDFIMDRVAYKQVYDGKRDDLLSAGLGKFGLKKDAFGKTFSHGNPAGPWEKAPIFLDNELPTPSELRRRAIYNNYRALLDMSTGHPTAYYGELYGPGVDAGGGEGGVAGEEYHALADNRVTMMVQIPWDFDVNNPCIVTAPSSGSRGIYGAIGTVGEWGLKRGFAVVYTDKGAGIGVHNLKTDTVNLVTGERCKVAETGNRANFIAVSENDDERLRILETFNRGYPDRVAYKHAHSGNNPEKDWGKYVLQSIKFAFYVLNKKFSDTPLRFTKENTIVIASSVSNGGGASIRAAEQDREGLIDGVAVGEPNVCPVYNDSFSIVQGNGRPFKDHSNNLLDYMTLLNVFQPCACLAPELEGAPFNPWYHLEDYRKLAENRCISLGKKGFLKSEGIVEQARESQKIINDYGILPEQNILQPSHHTFDIIRSISVTYANQYGRFDVTDNLCGYSFGATLKDNDGADDSGMAVGDPIHLGKEQEAKLFCDQNGVPPFQSVSLINNASVGGPKEDRISISPSTQIQDQNLDGALRLRSLVTGKEHHSEVKRVKQGIEEVRASGDLHGLPAVLPPNHTSRAYFGLNRVVEGATSNLHYYEVTNAHHLDTFNLFYSKVSLFYAPLHHYFIGALDLMYDHLRNGTPLPESQVIRTSPPKQKLPDISENPEVKDIIRFEDSQVKIPA